MTQLNLYINVYAWLYIRVYEYTNVSTHMYIVLKLSMKCMLWRFSDQTHMYVSSN